MNTPLPRPGALLLPLLLTVSFGCAAAARKPVETTGSRGHLEGGGETGGCPPGESGPVCAYVEADVRFIKGMIAHHAQAIEMTDLVPDRTGNEVIHRLARRIEISQRDEIARMRRWLESRGEEAPGEHAHAPLMPGMLTEEEMARLAAAEDAGFDRLFLELMIHHHEGALVMVADLAGTDGAGREPELFQLISHIDADQRAEIARLRGMLGTNPQGGTE